jgi:hypothetical protein
MLPGGRTHGIAEPARLRERVPAGLFTWEGCPSIKVEAHRIGPARAAESPSPAAGA